MNAKSLKRLQKDKINHPEKYIHTTSDYSKYLAMKYDADHGTLPPCRAEWYEELKKKYCVEEKK